MVKAAQSVDWLRFVLYEFIEENIGILMRAWMTQDESKFWGDLLLLPLYIVSIFANSLAVNVCILFNKRQNNMSRPRYYLPGERRVNADDAINLFVFQKIGGVYKYGVLHLFLGGKRKLRRCSQCACVCVILTLLFSTLEQEEWSSARVGGFWLQSFRFRIIKFSISSTSG